MPIVQISRIQNRRGLSSELPVSLDEGELGLTLDTGELFIGTPNLNQVINRNTTYPYLNTAILTEWSPSIEQLLGYRYRYRTPVVNGMNVQLQDWAKPKNDNGYYIVRRLQERLDESVSVKSYGAMGDGLTDDTFACRQAAIDVSNSTSGAISQYYRSLTWPAGTYNITEPVLIPPNSTWIGDGPFKTIISMIGGADCVAETTDGTIQVEDLTTQNGANVPLHTRYNILESNGLPENITIIGIHFKHAANNDIVRLFRARRVTFINCRFEGHWYCGNKLDGAGSSPTGSKYQNLSDSIAVVIDGLSGVPDPNNRDYDFINCQFVQTTYGFLTTDVIHNISVSDSVFENMYVGVQAGNNGIPAINQGYLTLPGPSGIILYTGGAGYADPVVVSITGGAGVGATAVATISSGTIGAITMTANGSGYTSAPTVTITGGGGSGATAVANISGGAVISITINTVGSGYENPPTAVITGGNGTGATASTTVVNGVIENVMIDNTGTGYTAEPQLSFIPSVQSSAQGIVQLGAPLGFHISSSLFRNIQNEGIAAYTGAQGITSDSNRFEGVGMGLNGDCTPGQFLTTPCIRFDQGVQNCSSFGDTFDRLAPFDPNNLNSARVLYDEKDHNLILNPSDPGYIFNFQSGYGVHYLLGTPVGNPPTYVNSDIQFSTLQGEIILMEYNMSQPNALNDGSNPDFNRGIYFRTGVLKIVQDGYTVTSSDTFTSLNGPDEVLLQASITPDGSTIIVQYRNNTTYDAKITINVTFASL